MNWRKQHKWVGLLFGFFILMFCISGIILNHRSAFLRYDVSRRWLPDAYLYQNWNGGLLRGTVSMPGDTTVLIYGNAGMWVTDSSGSFYRGFNEGLPEGADSRQIRSVVKTSDGQLFAAGQFGLFQRQGNVWIEKQLPLLPHERLSDAICKGDSLIVVGRSCLYVSVSPFHFFERLTLQSPAEYQGKVSLFRLMWMLHSGELFGTAGKLFVDAVGLFLAFLCITGYLYWIIRHYVRRRINLQKKVDRSLVRFLGKTLKYHDKLGRLTLFVTLFLCITGWCLRPPVLLALIHGEVTPPAGSALDSPNPWNDGLRMLRYDDESAQWLVSTSKGFYALNSLTDVPQSLLDTPPVSVMGVNVWERMGDGRWLVGSFSGLYIWHRVTGEVTDYYTQKKVKVKSVSPFGEHSISGYSKHFVQGKCVVDYVNGTPYPPMPTVFSDLPMSLWNVALEVHNGRFYTVLSKGTLFYVFIAGMLAVWCLWSGYRISRTPKNR